MIGSRSVGFWSAYEASKRPREVEELTDWVQRPLGYLIAKAAMPTPLTPNGITFTSMMLALSAGVAFAWPFEHHALIGGVLLFSSAIFDAADGQLARMRGTSSDHGRMIDGVADGVSAGAAIVGSIFLMWHKYAYDMRLAVLCLVGALLTARVGSQHTSMYDHYKNVWLHLVHERIAEGEDHATAIARMRKREWGLVMRVAWSLYLLYVKNLEGLVARFDPYTSPSVNKLPGYDPVRAETYRRHTSKLMPLWRFFGFGGVMLSIAVFGAFNLLEYCLVLRLFVLHPIFLFWVRPLQQRASREAFAEMGLELPAAAPA